MPKYQTAERKVKPIRRKEPHPIWRGIGCLILLIVPAMSLGLSTILVEMAPGLGIALPPGLLGRPLMPALLFRVPGLVPILNWIQRPSRWSSCSWASSPWHTRSSIGWPGRRVIRNSTRRRPTSKSENTNGKP